MRNIHCDVCLKEKKDIECTEIEWIWLVCDSCMKNLGGYPNTVEWAKAEMKAGRKPMGDAQ